MQLWRNHAQVREVCLSQISLIKPLKPLPGEYNAPFMKQFNLIFFFLFWGCFVLSAQQQVQYGLFSANPFLFNPAYAGMEDDLLMDVRWRSQWGSLLPGAPQSGRLLVQMPFYLGQGGIGLQLSRETLGAEEWLGAGVAYNFKGSLGDGVWALGAGLDYWQQNLMGDVLRTPEGNYEGGLIEHNDDALLAVPWQTAWLTANTGFFWQSDQWEAGLSVRGISLAAFAKQNPVVRELVPHYYLYAAYRNHSNRHWQWQTALLAKSDGLGLQTDLALLATWNGNISAGVALRGYDRLSRDAVVFSVGYRLSEKWQLMYSYDWTISALKRASEGAHEIWLQYALGKVPGKGKLPPLIYNPRF